MVHTSWPEDLTGFHGDVPGPGWSSGVLLNLLQRSVAGKTHGLVLQLDQSLDNDQVGSSVPLTGSIGCVSWPRPYFSAGLDWPLVQMILKIFNNQQGWAPTTWSKCCSICCWTMRISGEPQESCGSRGQRAWGLSKWNLTPVGDVFPHWAHCFLWTEYLAVSTLGHPVLHHSSPTGAQISVYLPFSTKSTMDYLVLFSITEELSLVGDSPLHPSPWTCQAITSLLHRRPHLVRMPCFTTVGFLGKPNLKAEQKFLCSQLPSRPHSFYHVSLFALSFWTQNQDMPICLLPLVVFLLSPWSPQSLFFYFPFLPGRNMSHLLPSLLSGEGSALPFSLGYSGRRIGDSKERNTLEGD